MRERSEIRTSEANTARALKPGIDDRAAATDVVMAEADVRPSSRTIPSAAAPIAISPSGVSARSRRSAASTAAWFLVTTFGRLSTRAPSNDPALRANHSARSGDRSTGPRASVATDQVLITNEFVNVERPIASESIVRLRACPASGGHRTIRCHDGCGFLIVATDKAQRPVLASAMKRRSTDMAFDEGGLVDQPPTLGPRGID